MSESTPMSDLAHASEPTTPGERTPMRGDVTEGRTLRCGGGGEQ